MTISCCHKPSLFSFSVEGTRNKNLRISPYIIIVLVLFVRYCQAGHPSLKLQPTHPSTATRRWRMSSSRLNNYFPFPPPLHTTTGARIAPPSPPDAIAVLLHFNNNLCLRRRHIRKLSARARKNPGCKRQARISAVSRAGVIAQEKSTVGRSREERGFVCRDALHNSSEDLSTFYQRFGRSVCSCHVYYHSGAILPTSL